MDEKTRLFDLSEINDVYIDTILKEVYIALEERGYNPINQIVGFLVSNDPGYICNHKEARSKITNLDRNKIIEFLLSHYVKDNI